MPTQAQLTSLLAGNSPHPVRVHLIGVAGSGMSGLAGLLLDLGHHVSGSDRVTTIETDRLAASGLTFHTPQAADNITADIQLVIHSSAIKPGNPEHDAAIRLGLPLILRAEALAALLAAKQGIIIAGMHGKTTTSSMAAHILRHAGLRPSHYVGAEIPILGVNAHWDPLGPHFVAEADESDGTITLYQAEHAIILNLEEEHLDHYRDLDHILDTFRQVMAHTRGKVIHCLDDTHAASVCATHPGAVSYGIGLGSPADYTATDIASHPFSSEFTIRHRGQPLGHTRLNVPGLHNVSNALAAAALATELGVPFPPIAAALETFRGARRRFERRYDAHGYLIVDDYGHHPTEIRRVLEAARNCGRRRVIALFQPHRHTRTAALLDDFAAALSLADKILLAPIYAAGETPVPGISSDTLAEQIRSIGHPDAAAAPSLAAIPSLIGPHLQPGDLILTLGAGDIHRVATLLAADLATAARLRETLGHPVRLHEPLARHTTLRVGGPAQFWAEPPTEAALLALVRFCRHEAHLPLLIIGRGSNLLIRDGGIPGVTAILNAEPFQTLTADPAAHTITAGAGVRLQKIAAAARKHRIGGFEWMEGIPGTLGGALRMNAGAMGVDTFSQVLSLRAILPDASAIATLTPADLEIHYRHVPALATHIALSATLQGHDATIEDIEKLLDLSKDKRRNSQPIAPSAGCIFKNPPATPAGRLVDELGLKNTTRGAARVSEIHGNFIVNDGGATARDILALIAHIQATAQQTRGIDLLPEVQILGEETLPLDRQ